ncbi:T9SS type A sorting domain-containing protein [candidate division KSB1 bacterium]|nr:T9SS type A sorting domain-containing protein [candidate division KSB1 bacterium]
MKTLLMSMLLALVCWLSGYAQPGEWLIYPTQTDSNITGNNEPHYVYLDHSVPALDNLLLFFPGTNATGWDYRLFLKTAAQMGYHVIGLSYENLASINLEVCRNTRDTTCHGRARQEIWFGEDTHDVIQVSYPNSVMNRLVNVLQELAVLQPFDGWQNFLNQDRMVNWSKVVAAGHSQGAGHAAFASKNFALKRVIMISWTDWMWPGRTAGWISKPGPTPDSSYYGFIHTGDASIYNGVPTTWNELGMSMYGPILSVDMISAPFDYTHSLITSAAIDTTPTQTNFHNATCVDWVAPVDANTGQPLFLPVWQYLLGVEPPQTQSAQRISPPGASYIDPELFSAGNKLAFQTGSGQVWLADIDPITGLFVSPSGQDVLIDQGATPLITSFNGPEFGVDASGWSIFYTKAVGLTPQIWRADVDGATVNNTPLTSGPTARLSTLATKSKTSSGIRLLFSKGASLADGLMGWLDVATPSQEVIVDSTDSGVRWIDGSRSFSYVKQTGPHKGQLAFYDTETQSESIITDDPQPKSYSYGWYAPEYQSLLVLAIIGDTCLAIYQDHGYAFWDRIATITVPPASAYRFVGSPEPFVAAGKSYISLVLKETATGSRYVNAEVWVLGIDPDPNKRYMKRCDDGTAAMRRTDPESYVGAHEIFIYYNLLNAENVFEIWRAATGISTSSTGLQNSPVRQPAEVSLYQNHPNPFNASTTIRFSLDRPGPVTLSVFDLLGRKTATLVDRTLPAGEHAVRFEASLLPSGLYFAHLKGRSFSRMIKLEFLK